MTCYAWMGHCNLSSDFSDLPFSSDAGDGSTKKRVINSNQLPQARYMVHRGYLSAVYE